MSINPQQYVPNEAWILFQLNEDPVQTISDGDVIVPAIMDVASGLIHGMEFLPSGTEQLSEFESKTLLNSAEAKVGVRPKYLFVDATHRHDRLKRAATALGIKTVPEEGKNLDVITEEARTGFVAHVKKGVR